MEKRVVFRSGLVAGRPVSSRMPFDTMSSRWCMRRLNNQGGVADAWRMMGVLLPFRSGSEDAIDLCHTVNQ